MKQVIFIHGGTTYDSYDEYLNSIKTTEYDPARDNRKRWKDSLQEKLGPEWHMLSPVMPSKYNAKYLEWKIWFDKVSKLAEAETILVGHSLGGIFLAKYLSEEKFPKKIRAVFLIAPPYDKESLGESLADFSLPIKLDLFAQQAQKIFLYFSKDDQTVPIANLQKYQDSLPNAIVKLFEDKRHFNQEEFPELIKEIKDLCA